MKITTIGLDIAKSVFHLYAVNKMGRFVKKKQLRRKARPGLYGKNRAVYDRDGSLWRRELLGERIYCLGALSQTHRATICQTLC